MMHLNLLKQNLFISFIIFVCIWLAAFSIYADSTVDIESETRRISDLLRCPTCQGLSVKESESSIAQGMKAQISSLLQQGKSEQYILDFFEERYGEWILRNPKKSGANLFLWWGPFLFFILGSVVFFIFIRKTARHNS